MGGGRGSVCGGWWSGESINISSSCVNIPELFTILWMSFDFVSKPNVFTGHLDISCKRVLFFYCCKW